jgi:CubicO group peptidase (beta-lactamase class C family)
MLLAALGGLYCFPALLHSQDRAADQLVKRTMKQWKIPGLALAVVQDDNVVYLKGFGERQLGTSAPITPDTVFPIASCTKSFTTLAMGMLVDEGKMGWDDPVRKHLPDFHLSDAHADALVTLRDLVTHRTGVATHDLLWFQSPWSLEERVKRAGKLEQARPFRSGFQYQVVLFGAAGLAVGSASGTTWQSFVQQRILDPLAMKSSWCAFPGERSSAELASPHVKGPSGIVVAPRYPLDEPDPAGSIHSTARDLAEYLRFQLGDGTWHGQRLISAESLAEPHTAQVVLRLEGAARAMNPETLFLHYGMGWVVQDYRGKLLVMHGGSIQGFRAHLTLVPEARLGLALLNNFDSGLANLALSNSLVELFLGLPAKDWSTYYLELSEQTEAEERARAKELRDRRAKDGGPGHPLASYVGTYEDSAYGTSQIDEEDGKLVWRWGKMKIPLEPYEEDTFLANYGPLVDAVFEFGRGKGGSIETLRAMDRVFRRVAK